MPSAMRLGDPLDCGDNSADGSSNVYINNLPVTRMGDKTTGHGCYSQTTMKNGNPSNVFVNGISACIVTSSNESHCCGPSCHSGQVSEGSSNVFIGG